MLASLLVRTVTVITAGTGTDRYGDTEPDWTTATETDVPGWLAQQQSLETVSPGRDATSTTMTLTVPAGTAITAANRVRIDDVLYEVVGAPLSAWTPRGEHHIEVQLRYVLG